MTGQGARIGDTALFVCADAGPLLSTEADALDLIGAVGGADAAWVVIPACRLDAAFFDLSTRIAGAFLQKLVNYHIRVAIIGDIGCPMARSGALRDFVRECNRGTQIWFAEDLATLAARLREAEGVETGS